MTGSAPTNLIVVDHPLVQYKLTMARRAETSTAVFRDLLREIPDAGLETLVDGAQIRVLGPHLLQPTAIETGIEVGDGSDDAADGEECQGTQNEAHLEGRKPPLAEFGPRVGDEDDGMLLQGLGRRS